MAIAVFTGRRFEVFYRFGKSFQEFSDRGFLVHADCRGIGAHERAAENASGPMRDVFTLELVEQRQLDLRLLRDRRESDLLLFTLLPKSSAETLWHTSEFASESTMTGALATLKIRCVFSKC